MAASAWSTPKAHEQQTRTWCFQCGEEGRPVPAIGWDEEGEPACSGHAKMAATPLKLSEPIEVPPCTAEPIKPTAAPSPVQTSVEEAKVASYLNPEQLKRAIQLKALGYSVTEIAAELGVPTWKLYQTEEYKNAPSGERDSETAGPKKKRGPKVKRNQDGRTPLPASSMRSLGGPLQLTETTPVNLSAEKLDKLWGMLSLADKAAAIEHVL